MLTREEAYEQYLKSITPSEEPYTEKIKITEKDREILLKAAKKILKKKFLLTQKIEPSEGDVFVILDKNLYFVLSDLTQYPYEVFLASPFWELASEKDLLVDVEGEIWVLESVIRYVDKEILKNSAKVGTIDKKDLNIMKKFVFENKTLPRERKGFKVLSNPSVPTPLDLFKKSETERSLFLTTCSLFNSYATLETPEVVQYDMRKEEIEDLIMQESHEKLAASSFENFLLTEFGELIKDKNNIIMNFKKDFIGAVCKIHIHGKTIYEGALPERLNITTNIKHIEDMENKIVIEIL